MITQVGYSVIGRLRGQVAVTPRISNPYDYVNHMFKRP
jgi:hypothetical protein